MSDIFNKMLVAMSGTESSEAAAELGIKLAKAHQAQLSLVYVVDTGLVAEMARLMGRPEEQLMADMESNGLAVLRRGEHLAKQSGIHALSVLRRGSPPLEIVAEAASRRADLILLGSTYLVGPHPPSLGRVVERVIEHSDCPVLVVRHRVQSGVTLV
mgnify:CR=1 FL=1